MPSTPRPRTSWPPSSRTSRPSLPRQDLGKIAAELEKFAPLLDGEPDDDQYDALVHRLSKFFYFSTDEMLPGECDLTALVARAKADTAKGGDHTMLPGSRAAATCLSRRPATPTPPPACGSCSPGCD
ncbi:hypothetical protein ACFV0O_26970 [Kitasatospora sp. NPDC059577]|uniref:hypothetical protein n=1 Tax=Kitasatospora sp. NPDC059577 TaxID=3346873 RepID=UPI0036B49954